MFDKRKKLTYSCSLTPLTPLLSLFVFTIFLCFIQWQSVNCYNLSPIPNLQIKDPQLFTHIPKNRSSYFGFSLLLRKLGIFVGAPRAQPTLESQRKIEEPGAIYRCSLTNSTCYPYYFEKNGNIFDEEYNDYIYKGEKRDNQWLGGSMDGGPQDTDKFIVCAPRLITPLLDKNYLLHGICYWVNDTLSEQPVDVHKISPLKLKSEQDKKSEYGTSYFYYIYAEQGLSVHITPDNEEFIIGAPGLHTWKGSVIRVLRHLEIDDPIPSRRDLESRRSPRSSDKTRVNYYTSEILNPARWNQDNDSYFGYSVSSGYFDIDDSLKLSYVATAPQAEIQSGEAYLFDIVGDSIKKRFVFRGIKFGEYFGYSMLAEDINNDGLTDVIISAPQHSLTGIHDDGAIYVFINKGRYQFSSQMFESPIPGKGRFGTTIAKLGDINHDGYNDIAVSAPFAAENGVVFIYLGGANGLRKKPSQRLDSPKNFHGQYGPHMFGHGLSKGVDIDDNSFNDFAIGAPNAEGVFLYRAYPVIEVQTSISSKTREIQNDQRTFTATVCYGFSTTSSRVQDQPLSIRIVMDPTIKRVKFLNTQSNERNFTVTATRKQQCQDFECNVQHSVVDIFKPIELEVHHQVINGVPNSEVFCDNCVATDPDKSKVYTERLIFSTGCSSQICIADLEVKSVNLDHSYVLGNSRILSATYEIINYGETAYLPQINFTSSNNMTFGRIPSSCNNNKNPTVLLCDLNHGQRMENKKKVTITVTYEVGGISGTSMVLTAQAFSTGKEKNPGNNKIEDVIALREYTQVDVIGTPITGHINLEKVKNTAQFINNYEIKSNGPSSVGSLEIVFNIPVAYKIPGSNITIPIVDVNNITMQAVKDAQRIPFDFYQDQNQLLLNSFEVQTKTVMEEAKVLISQNGALYDSIKIGHVNEMTQHDDLSSSDNIAATTSSHRRRRRDVMQTAGQTATTDQYARIMHAPAGELLDEDMRDHLPVNRTIVFNCNDSKAVECVRAVIQVYNFVPENPVVVSMKYNVDLNEVNQILTEPWEFFVVYIRVDLKKISTILDPTSLAVNRKIEYNIISKHQLYSYPIWIIIVSILGGLLVLALMTYAMYKAGFFKRNTKAELDRLVNQDTGLPEEENLNAGDH